jgi:4a-hydroxytetrahydrobiopterin dehydratase
MILSEAQINSKLKSLPNWTTNGQEITHTYVFKDFLSAIDFVNSLVQPAENAGHHPDISISYNKVTINLTTHDQGGITDKDFALAQQIDAIANTKK